MNINNQATCGFIILIAALQSGCSHITKQTDKPIATATTEAISTASHYYDVLDVLGPPASISSLTDGFAFQYETLQIDEQQFGLSADVSFLRWFKLSYGRARVDREVHTFVFNRAGYVQAYGKKKIKDDAGKGISYQFVVKVTQVVDTGYLEKEPPQNGWGLALLQPLPVAMNSGQSMDSGLSGLEQRGTSTSIGQRTLELRDDRKSK